MQFVAYPDVSNSDLMSALFHEEHIESGRKFLVSHSFDTSLSGEELHETIQAYSGVDAQGNPAWSTHMSVYGEAWVFFCKSSSLNIAVTFSLSGTNVWLNLSTESQEDAEVFLEAIREGLPPVKDEDDRDKIQVRFWMLGMQGNPTSQLRTLDTFHWSDVERNYPKAVKGQLSELMEMPAPKVGGKLILWHGHPGGGKTSAIKTLVDSWKGWADAEYIVDPEAFFGSAAYMINVLNRNPNPFEDGTEKWRLIIIEDAGQFVHRNADTTTGQAFSRLLNVTDGMIGQGMKVIVLITTNQPLSEMHEALRRPGRCLANIEFSKFTPSEAAQWLGRPSSKEMSLAELYEETKNTQVNTEKEHGGVGQYL